MHYLDTSALVKLVFEERESSALEAFLGEERVAVSALSRTELRRVALRVSPEQLQECDQLLQSCYEVTLTPGVLDEAGLIEPPTLRSLDAIHLACARAIEPELSSFVAYDDRLIDAATSSGLEVIVPR